MYFSDRASPSVLSPAPLLAGGSAKKEIAPPAAGAMNQNLSSSLRADFQALQNDFEQANALTLDLQCQLAGKSNEFAQLKHVFEKTALNLNQLQRDITELREERHRLANQAMLATALDFSLQKTVAERDQLKLEIGNISRERDEQISRLTAELKAAKAGSVSSPTAAAASRATNPVAASILAEMARSMEQLRAAVGIAEGRPASFSPSASLPGKVQPEPDFIAIAYS